MALKALVLAVAVATPLVPGLPDLTPAPPEENRPPEQRDPPRQEASPPSREAERVCDRMAAPWGSDSASGAPRDPFRTPGRVATSLRPGWNGCLRGGTYVQPEVLVQRRKVTLRSAPGERATWRGRIVLAGRRDKLIGLNLDGSAGPRCRSGTTCSTLPSPTITAAEVVVSDNDIANPRAGICVHPRRWRSGAPDRFVIQRNRIHDCGRRPPTNRDHGIYVADGELGLVRDNVVYANADRGIQLYPQASRTRILRNTVDGNGSGVIFSERSAGNLVRDNVFTHALVRWNAESYRLSGRGNRFEDNCVRPGNPDSDYNANGGVRLPALVAQSGNVEAGTEPYRDRAKGDFRLVPGGPCAGKGARDATAAP
jgi:parallel beta helix pectate lyase-like protein